MTTNSRDSPVTPPRSGPPYGMHVVSMFIHEGQTWFLGRIEEEARALPFDYPASNTFDPLSDEWGDQLEED